VNRRRHPLQFWWKEPRQYTIGILWKPMSGILKIRNMKFLLYYRLSFETFNNLVLELRFSL
jgi:hypothetical protein